MLRQAICLLTKRDVTAVVVGHDSGTPIRMVYTESGRDRVGSTVLLLHGLFDHRGTWSLLTPALVEAGFRVVVPDLVGFGHSSRPRLLERPPEERYSLDMQVGFLRNFIRELELDDLVIIGNSLGGGAALRLLCTPWPSAPRLRGLVLDAAAGHPQPLPPLLQLLIGWPGRLLLLPWVHRLALATGLARFLTRRTYRRAFYDSSAIPPELVDDALDSLRLPNTLYCYRESVRNMVPEDAAAFPARYADIDVPTLILWGREDQIVPPLFALLFEESIPRSTLHVFDECGHAPHLELPIETAVVIRDWMRRHTA